MRQFRTLLTSLALFLFALPAMAAGPGERIKLPCPNGPDVNDPCRAVYYWGADGKRHAFPNEDIYYSWFGGFTDVKTVDAGTMAGLTLGQPVGYRPGSRMVKFLTEPRTYAIDADGSLRWVTTEAVARAMYGERWAVNVRDLPDTLATTFRYGAPIGSNADLDPVKLLDTPMTPDSVMGVRYSYGPVTTSRGTFDAHEITLDRTSFRMRTMAAGPDCGNDCAAKPLAEHAKDAGAAIGIHGSYFCPPDYADCAGKINSFLSPMFDSPSGTMRMQGSIPFHNGPMVAAAKDGKTYFFRRATDFGNPSFFASTHGSELDAALANYPALVDGGANVSESEPRLEDGMKTNKATRGAIGFSDSKISLVIAKSVTVPELAEVMVRLGATSAMNLDGGGSSALLYGGAYKVGPGRPLPNAIVFTQR
jgi:hypothetical protein